MGVKFIEHLGGGHIYSCIDCGTSFTNSGLRRSTHFYARTGPAYLFTKVVNMVYGEAEERIMRTGSHIVRDAICKKCNKVIGWIYEFAYEKDQRYKEGMVILERAYVSSHPGIREIPLEE